MMKRPSSTYTHHQQAFLRRSMTALGLLSEVGQITARSTSDPQAKSAEGRRVPGRTTQHKRQTAALQPRSNAARDALSP